MSAWIYNKVPEILTNMTQYLRKDLHNLNLTGWAVWMWNKPTKTTPDLTCQIPLKNHIYWQVQYSSLFFPKFWNHIYRYFCGEVAMLEVTKSATDEIAKYFRGKEVKPIRIFLNSGGWGGPGLALALDEPKDTDDVFKINGFQFVINTDLLKQAEPIKVDFSPFGFRFDCALQFDEGCTACSTCG